MAVSCSEAAPRGRAGWRQLRHRRESGGREAEWQLVAVQRDEGGGDSSDKGSGDDRGAESEVQCRESRADDDGVGAEV